jgi:S-adenosylmethionine:tRNA ribosyltransferase-isomerase
VKTSEFDFYLPETSIAAFPTERRDDARLLVLGRADGAMSHARFSELEPLLPRRSLVVLNDSRVFPARLFGRRKTGGRVELLLIRKLEPAEDLGPEGALAATPRTAAPCGEELWDAIGRHLARVRPGAELVFPGGLEAVLVAREAEGGLVRLRLRPPVGQTVASVLEAVGEIPIPPYIVAARRVATGQGSEEHQPALDSSAEERASADARALDRVRYQTVYADAPGSVAAPTAGLHFTRSLLDGLRAAGHDIVTVTLHVGPGTFRPVKVEEVEEHRMDPEWYSITEAASAAIEAARREARPIVAVGTTVVRTLESAALASADGRVRAGTASSRLYLRPPDARFQVVTDLITNFHLPRSTLLMLVAAFAGPARIHAAYQAAVAAGYRFYSYGDAMFIRGSA